MKINQLNLKIVEKFKIFIAVALALIIAGFAVMAINGMNIGIDFAGGAKIEINLGDYLSNNPDAKEGVKTIVSSTVKDNGFEMSGIRWSDTSEGTVTEISLNYKYNGKKIDSSSIKAQQDFLVLVKGSTENTEEKGLTEKLSTAIENYSNTNLNGDLQVEEMSTRIVNASTSNRLLKNAIWATAVAIVAMLIYIIIRFTLSSGIAAVIALCHDMLVMIAFTTIFRIQVNTTFIAAIITIVGYSINATIVIFDRIKEVSKLDSMKGKTDAEIANKSIVDTLGRTIVTTLTTMVVILALAIVCMVLGVTTIEEFALPIIFGLIAGTYSSVFLSASFWVILRKLGKKITDKKTQKKPLQK